MAGEVTMRDVADRAGVSLSTVSFAINKTRPVSTATRRRIQDAMDSLGYRRNEMARALASRRSRILALLLPARQSGLDPTHMEFVTSAAETARALGYHLMVWPAQEQDGSQARVLAEQRLADGVIVMEVDQNDQRLQALRETRTPHVLIGRSAEAETAPFVDIDFAITAATAVDTLADLGHRAIGFINRPAESYRRGYGPALRMDRELRAACAARRLAYFSRCADESAAAGAQAVDALLAEYPAPTAVVAMNDAACYGALLRLAQLRIGVPQRISVLSTVSSPAAGARTIPVLSRLDAPGAELARLGVEALIAALEGDNWETMTLARLLPCRPASDGGTVGPAWLGERTVEGR